MKKLYMLLCGILLIGFSYAQQYTINVCGNIANYGMNGTNPTVAINYYQFNNSGQLTASPDPMTGNYCVSFIAFPDSATSYYLNVNGYMADCNGDMLGDTLWFFGNSDTTVYMNFDYCDTTGVNPPACSSYYTYVEDTSMTGTVYFNASVTNGTAPFTYVWDFGDGTISTTTTANAVHTYPSTGNSTFYACLTVTDAAGCSSNYCYYVQITPGNNGGCSSQFTYTLDPNANCCVYSFVLYATGTAPYVYTWDFGDGTTSNLASPTHTFTGSGYYYVCVEVVDANGCTSTSCSYVYVSNGNNNTWCYSDFYGYYDPMGTNLEVYFYDYSYPNAISWAWDFGDGSSSTSQNPVHTYAQSGFYDVCLTTTDATGCTDTYCVTYWIDNSIWNGTPNNPTGCYADFMVFQDSLFGNNGGIGTNNVIYLVNFSYGSNLSYFWDFGDGTTSTDAYPAHTFAANQLYYICLTVTDSANNCSDTFCDSLGVDSTGNIIRSQGFSVQVISGPLPSANVGVKEEVKTQNKLNAFPNPVADKLVLNFNDMNLLDLVNVQVYSMNGELVMNQNIQPVEGTEGLNVANLPAGIYHVVATAEGLNLQTRFVKTR